MLCQKRFRQFLLIFWKSSQANKVTVGAATSANYVTVTSIELSTTFVKTRIFTHPGQTKLIRTVLVTHTSNSSGLELLRL